MAKISLTQLREKYQSNELSLNEKISLLRLENEFLLNEKLSEEFQFDEIIDTILGYNDFGKLEKKRNNEGILSAVGYAKWSKKTLSDGYSSSYNDIKLIFKEIEIKSGDVFVDIGSSYGRVGNIVGANYPNTQFLGYEIVRERAIEAQRVAKLLQLSNVNYFCTDVSASEFNIPEANWFFLYDSLNNESLAKILEKISMINSNRKARLIVKFGGGLLKYTRSPYLELVFKSKKRKTIGEFWVYQIK